ncbi:unnamed protein product, partial [Oikopleura dioica]
MKNLLMKSFHLFSGSSGMDRSASMTSMNRSLGLTRTASPKHSRNNSRDLRVDRELAGSPRLTGSPRMSPVPRSSRPVKKDKNSDDESEGVLLRKPPTPPSGRTTPGTNFGNDSEFEMLSASGSVFGEKKDEPMDLQLENKLLRQEMNSLNIEISRLMDVQRKTERELTLTNSELQRRRQSEIDERDAEFAVAMKEKETRAKEIDQRETQWEIEKSTLSEALAKAQILLQQERTKSSEAQSQYRTFKTGMERIQVEFEEYKVKSQRILQSKEKLIESLKNSDPNLQKENESSENQARYIKLEELQHENDLIKSENRIFSTQIQDLRADLQQAETQAAEDFEQSGMRMSELEINFEQTQQRLNELTPELARLRMELGQSQRENETATIELSRLTAEKDREIGRLRSKVMSHASNTELEKRLRTLTDTVIEKQTTIETLSSDKSALSLELERTRMRSNHAQIPSSVVRKRGHVEIDAESLITDSTNDAVGKLKRAVGALDKLSIRIGVLLKRYPTVRLLVLVYMIMLHVW